MLLEKGGGNVGKTFLGGVGERLVCEIGWSMWVRGLFWRFSRHPLRGRNIDNMMVCHRGICVILYIILFLNIEIPKVYFIPLKKLDDMNITHS